MTLSDSLVLALSGFVLTTVAGGILGAFLQTRLWKHQWSIQRRCKAEEEARAVFEEVSRLMDRRLFRVSQLRTWIHRKDEQRTQRALADYQDIIKEWNDSINRTLSLLQFYFGAEIRKRFDFGVGTNFVNIGARIEEMYRSRETKRGSVDAQISADIEQLRADVYSYNLSMLHCLDRMAADSQPRFFDLFKKAADRSVTPPGSNGDPPTPTTER